MSAHKHWIRDLVLFVLILLSCLLIGILLQDVFLIPEQVTTTFAFAVFLISLLTDGYWWGIAASVASLLLVNYAFTFPYFMLNFTIPSNFFSAVVMAVISVLTSALTTKIKRQEAIRAETEREKMRANLLRAISHDLRTPLTTIYGSITALREHGDSLTPEQKDRMLQGIQKDSQWLVRMVENLLAVTRIDNGNIQIEKISTAVDELVDSVLVKFNKHYPGQKVVLELPEELVLVPMDGILMEQVLINLLGNAVEHGTGLTELVLRVSLENSTAVFEVRDNGCGIAPERLPLLFSGEFEQSGRPVDHAKRNAGIGLSLCATIIRAHGGTIFAENDPSGGAVFRFTLEAEEMIDEQQD